MVSLFLVFRPLSRPKRTSLMVALFRLSAGSNITMCGDEYALLAVFHSSRPHMVGTMRVLKPKVEDDGCGLLSGGE